MSRVCGTFLEREKTSELGFLQWKSISEEVDAFFDEWMKECKDFINGDVGVNWKNHFGHW